MHFQQYTNTINFFYELYSNENVPLPSISYGIKRLYRRFLFWDNFGYPEYMVDRFIGNYQSIHKLWWFEPEKIKSLKEAMENDEQLPVNEVDIRYWPDWNKSKK